MSKSKLLLVLAGGAVAAGAACARAQSSDLTPPGSAPAGPTVVMEDDFDHSASTMDGRTPTKGTDTWQVNIDSGTPNGAISIFDDKAQVSLNGGTPGAGTAQLYYPLTPEANTRYTLAVTFYLNGTTSSDAWAGCGYCLGGNDSPKASWLLVRPPSTAGGDMTTAGLQGVKGVDNETAPGSLFPTVTCKAVFDTKAKTFALYVGDVSTGSGALAPGEVDHVFLSFYQCGKLFSVQKVVLTAEPSP